MADFRTVFAPNAFLICNLLKLRKKNGGEPGIRTLDLVTYTAVYNRISITYEHVKRIGSHLTVSNFAPNSNR